MDLEWGVGEQPPLLLRVFTEFPIQEGSDLCTTFTISKILQKMVINTSIGASQSRQRDISPCNEFYTFQSIHSTTTNIKLQNLLSLNQTLQKNKQT
jgi:hypothetical protein